VEGSDLIVRDQRLFLKTLRGLVPVHGLLKRLDDQYLDPLELRPDSTLGVPGLLQAIRAGNVLVANAPGSAFLESPALLGFMPALLKQLLGEELLSLPALPTWWCGERSAMEAVLPHLWRVRHQTHLPGLSIHPAALMRCWATAWPQRALDEWAGRIVRQSEDAHGAGLHAAVANAHLASGEAGKGDGRMAAALRHAAGVCRCLTGGRDRSWRVLPGGLARVAGASADIASMQQGGSSADVWALTQGEVDNTTLLHHRTDPRRAGPAQTPGHQPRRRKPVLAGPLHRTRRKLRAPGPPDAGVPGR